MERDAFLRSNGFRILPFWNGDVMERLDNIFETIHQALLSDDMDRRFD
jgi:very-short-patch-repair endonuclease